MKGVLRLAMILFVVCSFAAATLALVADVTAEPIAEQARRETQEALRTVAPEATEFTETGEDAWDAIRDGDRIGRVRALTAKGYGGPIRMVAGLDTESRITGVRVITQTETPGLGTKVAGDAFLAQFRGKTPAELGLRKDGGPIDAVAAATISSRAVTNTLRDTLGGQ